MSFPHRARSALAVFAAALVIAAPLAVFADAPVPGKVVIDPKSQSRLPSPLYPKVSPAKDPMVRVLSGPGWTAAAGLEPRLHRSEGPALEGLDINPLTRTNYQFPAASSYRSPSMQVGGVSVPYRDPGPAFSRNMLITRDYSNAPIQLEPHLAVDPQDPNHVVVGVIDYNFPGVSIYVTFDGGENWQGPIQTRYVREDLIAGGDPVLAFDRKGNVYLVFISIGIEEFQIGRFATLAVVSSIAITSSKDGGLTWSDPVATARRLPSTELQSRGPGAIDDRVRGEILIPFLDKPWLSIGPDPADKSKDLIHVSFTEFVDVENILYVDEIPFFATVELRTTIRTVRSADLGLTWSDPVSASPTVTRASGTGEAPGDSIAEGQLRVVQGSEPHAAPDGTLYVSWIDSTDDDSQEGLAEVHVARSDDGGKTYGRPVRAAVINEPGFRPETAFFRYWGTVFPKTAIGPQGEVYVVYGALNAAKPTDDGDIFFIRSTDKGVTWTRPKRLSGDDTSRLQFFPAIATDPAGNLHVMWADMRNDPRQTSYHIYYTTSSDKGDTWGFVDARLNLRTEDTRVSDFPSNPNHGFPNGLFIGDYFAIAAAPDEVYMVWADTRLGEFSGGVNQKVAFARKRAIPNPEVFISPPTGAGGQEITVQAFNLQPGILAYVQVGGSITSVERTNQDGRFTARLFVPVTGEGAQDVRIVDESGNIASTSYYTEFGFNSIRDQQRKIETQLTTLTGGAAPTPGGAPADKEPGAAWWMVALAGIAGVVLGSIAAMAMRPRGRDVTP